jgi:hypothetical protein
VFRRRRPLLRGAAAGAAGYAIGKRVARNDEEASEEYVDEEPGAISGSAIDELKELAELKEAGVLTEDEFQEQKERILQSG